MTPFVLSRPKYAAFTLYTVSASAIQHTCPCLTTNTLFIKAVSLLSEGELLKSLEEVAM